MTVVIVVFSGCCSFLVGGGGGSGIAVEEFVVVFGCVSVGSKIELI